MKLVTRALALLMLAPIAASAKHAAGQEPQKQSATPACKDVEGLGIVVDDAVKKGALDPILTSIAGVAKYFADTSVNAPDLVWDRLSDCANQSHSESERAEALRIAAAWEHWYLAMLRVSYHNNNLPQPVRVSECKGLSELTTDVMAGWPIPDSLGRHYFPPGYKFPGDEVHLGNKLAACSYASQNANKRRPVPEYVQANWDLKTLQLFETAEDALAAPSETAHRGELGASSPPRTNEVPGFSVSNCDQIITVAGLTPSGLALYIPTEGQTFMAKHAKNYRRMCLVETTNATSFAPSVPHYLLVWAYSEAAYAGLQPVQQVTTSPVSGSGTLTNTYGERWNFSYTGTTTEIDTVEAPYVLQSRTLYLWAYDAKGNVVSRHSITTSSQVGGDSSYAAGYNAGALISLLWNNPSHLIKSVLKDVQKASGH
ncbi:MAG TPA: hypothetical protein VJN93_06535 [Candidatus Acidoferrum sp.]|nr:hypothetical protein [Candidatus Acidoferrum sp.]